MPTKEKNPEICKSFGLAVRKARLGRGISQEQLAFNADLDRTYVGGIERGERNPSLLNMKRLANALDVSLSSLMADAEL